ncbi:MATE family efflux transporter, partial [Paraburkholderia sp. SIMBA_055]
MSVWTEKQTARGALAERVALSRNSASNMNPTGMSRALSGPPTLSRHAADTARLAAPLAIAQLSQMAMSVTDTVLLGSLGPDALA